MPIPLQAVALLGAGYVLWRLWRVSEQAPPLLRFLIAGGFVIRSFAAQFLFWVSWLELPFGRSLQLGNGLWFFGLDALVYFGPAVQAAENGLLAILRIRASLPSVVFVRVLALFAWLFGSVVSVAILLNVAVYLGMSLLIVRWAVRVVAGRRLIYDTDNNNAASQNNSIMLELELTGLSKLGRVPDSPLRNSVFSFPAPTAASVESFAP